LTIFPSFKSCIYDKYINDLKKGNVNNFKYFLKSETRLYYNYNKPHNEDLIVSTIEYGNFVQVSFGFYFDIIHQIVNFDDIKYVYYYKHINGFSIRQRFFLYENNNSEFIFIYTNNAKYYKIVNKNWKEIWVQLFNETKNDILEQNGYDIKINN